MPDVTQIVFRRAHRWATGAAAELFILAMAAVAQSLPDGEASIGRRLRQV